MRSAILVAPILGAASIAVVLARVPASEHTTLAAAAAIAVVAGLCATLIGVYGAVLVPGLLVAGVEPRVAAALSLLLQVVVSPLGVGSHALRGHVRRSIAAPLVVGGAIGSIAGALAASAVPPDIAARFVALVITVVGVVVLANLWSSSTVAGAAASSTTGPGIARIATIGVTAGLASGISGAGWGPIGVKLLILAGVEPRHAVGSWLVGRVGMASAGIVTYAVTSAASGFGSLDPALFVVLLAGSAGAIVPGAPLIGRIARRPAAAGVAILSIGLALPTVLR